MEMKLVWVLVIVFFFSGCSSRNTPAPVIESKTAISLKRASQASITSKTYVVKKGETLYSIAWRAKTDVRTLAGLNKLAPPYQIFPNQTLKLSQKIAKARPHKSSSKNSNKSTGSTTTKVHKKPVASNKKPAYGGNVGGQKSSTKSPANTTVFSQKIRKWQWPVKGRVISTFSSSQQGNKGIDIAGRRGDKVKVAADGKVVYAGNALRGYGKLVIVKHNDDYLSAYAHNDQILVKEQQVIKAGDVIAKMGDTDADRVMLHFEVRFRGKSVNPMKYLPKK